MALSAEGLAAIRARAQAPVPLDPYTRDRLLKARADVEDLLAALADAQTVALLYRGAYERACERHDGTLASVRAKLAGVGAALAPPDGAA